MLQETEILRRAHSIAETCALTGVGRDGIYAAIRDGRLVARKLGRRTLIVDEDLRQFLAGLPRAGGHEQVAVEIPSKTKAATEAAREVKSGVVT